MKTFIRCDRFIPFVEVEDDAEDADLDGKCYRYSSELRDCDYDEIVSMFVVFWRQQGAVGYVKKTYQLARSTVDVFTVVLPTGKNEFAEWDHVAMVTDPTLEGRNIYSLAKHGVPAKQERIIFPEDENDEAI